MVLLNILGAVSSIISLIIAIFIAGKVTKIKQTLNVDNSKKTGNQIAIGKQNQIAGESINDK